MARTVNEVLAATARDVLEEAAFVFATPARREIEWPASVVEVELDFAGPVTGRLWLRCTPDLGALVAANLMGIEPSEPEAAAQAETAAGELLNIVAGALLARIHGTREVFHLGLPRVRHVPSGGPAPAPAVGLVADDLHPLELAIAPAAPAEAAR